MGLLTEEAIFAFFFFQYKYICYDTGMCQISIPTDGTRQEDSQDLSFTLQCH